MSSLPHKRVSLGAAALFALCLAGAGACAATASADDLPSLWASLVVAAVAGLTAAVLGGAYALLAERALGRRLWLGLGLTPLLIPPFLTVVSFRATLGPGGHLPRAFGVEAQGPSVLMQSWIYSAPCAGFLQGVSWAPLVFLAVAALLHRVPRAPLEAARLARGPWGARRLLARALLPGVLLGAGACVALSVIEYAGPILLRVPVQAERVAQAFDAERDPGLALRRALPLFALAGAALLLPLATWRAPLPGSRRATPAPRGWAALACGVTLLPGLWIPLLDLGLRLTRGTDALTALRQGLAVGGSDAWRSFLVAASAASAALALGLVCAWPLRRVSLPRLALVLFPAACAAAIPPALLGVAFLVAFNRDGFVSFLDSLASVASADLIRFGGVALILLCFALRGIPRSREEAARLAGRRPLPLALSHLAPALVAAWSLVYLLSLTEFGASSLLAPPGKSLLAVFVVNEAHYGQGAELAALSTLLLATALAPLIVFAGLLALAPRLRGRP